MGRRVCYLKPITLFFTLNILFVMLSPISDFYVSLLDQITLQPYSLYIKTELDDYLLRNGISYSDFEKNYNQLVVVLARSLIILQVPIFGLFSLAVLPNKKFYSGDYFNFSLNFHSWLLVWIIVAMAPAFIAAIVIQLLGLPTDPKQIYFLLIPIGALFYLIFSLRLMFNLSWIQCLWRIPLLMIALHLSHTIFRLVQFLITASLVEV
jgi:hypothetical protein